MNEDVPTVEVWLTFAGVIDSPAVHRFFAIFQGALADHVTKAHLLIQSSGGSIGDGIAIYNYLRHLPLEIITYNAGSVESIAVLPYLAGRKRRASKESTFMIHKATFTPQAPLGSMVLSMMADAANLYDANVERILRSEISLPDEKWAAHETSDLVFSAEDAASYKMVHEFSDFKPPRGGMLFNI